MKTLLCALALSLAVSASALACSFNTDCNVGSKCMKQPGRTEGVCVGGMDPGEPQRSQNRSNADPYQWPRRQTQGQQCQFRTDCDSGQMCLKEAGRLYGVCVRG